jgi:hypothetical protein
MLTLITAFSALVVGFLTGLFSFKTKSRWCPQCGSWTFSRTRPDHHGVGRA